MDNSDWAAMITAMQNFIQHLTIGEDSQLVTVATVGGGPLVRNYVMLLIRGKRSPLCRDSEYSLGQENGELG